MARIPQRFIDDLLDRVDIVDVVSSRIDLRKSGKNYSARCPFHNEKTPSFTVSPDKQFFYCFGCGAGGNALGFVMDHDHMGFVDAVEVLARQAGMEVPKDASPKDSRIESRRRKLYAMLAEADQFFRQQLRSHGDAKMAVDYLKNRGLSGDIARTFGIGFAPQGWDNLISRIALDDDDVALMVEAGLAIRKEDDAKRVYDRFRNRIIFPIRDTRGRTIGFGGRVLDDSKPKYLNSPETPVFHKGRELYGLYEAHKELREITSLIVVEGYMDVVALSQHGIHNAVATLGTAATSEHLEKLFRYTPEVIFCFDGDDAGRRAASRALETSLPVMTDGRSARFLFLPEGEDPDTLVRKLGKEGFQKQVNEAQPLSEFLFTLLTENLNTGSLDGKARLSQLAAPMINRMPAGVFRQLMLKELARRTDMDLETLTGIIAPPPPAPAPDTEHPGSPSPDHSEQPPPYPENYPDYEEGYSYGYDGGDYGETGIDQGGYEIDHAGRAHPTGGGHLDNRRRLKLSPLRRLILLILHNPQLRTEVESLNDLHALEEADAALLVDLCQLLDDNPHYSLNHILGYWRGIHGPERGEALAQIAAADMSAPKTQPNKDDIAEFRDIFAHLNRQLQQSRPARQRLEMLLAKGELSAEDRKQITGLLKELSPEDKSELYQQIKQSLAPQRR